MKNHTKKLNETLQHVQTHPAKKPLRILIADDHAIVRKGLKQVLIDDLGPVEFGEASNGHDALAQVQKAQWDIALLDVTMPGPSRSEERRVGKECRSRW